MFRPNFWVTSSKILFVRPVQNNASARQIKQIPWCRATEQPRDYCVERFLVVRVAIVNDKFCCCYILDDDFYAIDVTLDDLDVWVVD